MLFFNFFLFLISTRFDFSLATALSYINNEADNSISDLDIDVIMWLSILFVGLFVFFFCGLVQVVTQLFVLFDIHKGKQMVKEPKIKSTLIALFNTLVILWIFNFPGIPGSAMVPAIYFISFFLNFYFFYKVLDFKKAILLSGLKPGF